MTSEPGRMGVPRDCVELLAGSEVDRHARLELASCDPLASLREIAWLMARHRSSLLTLGAPPGAPAPPAERLITARDLIATARRADGGEVRAGELAAEVAVSVYADEPLDRAAELLAAAGLAELVVRNRHDTAIGVISALDVARAIAGLAG